MFKTVPKSQKCKLYKSFIATALLGVVVAFVVVKFFNITFGWFSNNNDIDGNGMIVQVDYTNNLVISNSQSEIVKSGLMEINNSPFFVSLGTNNTMYSPSTHDSNYEVFSTGLKYVRNTDRVGINSGLSSGGALLYEDAVNSNVVSYYLDCVVYVAAHGKAINNAKLTASIDSAKKNGVDVSSGSLMATSIDFYEGTTISISNFKGTLNVAGYDALENDYATEKTMIYLVGSDSTTGTIPLNTSGNYLTYTLRFYFDGALLSSDGQAFVNSATLDYSKVVLTVLFSATSE